LGVFVTKSVVLGLVSALVSGLVAFTARADSMYVSQKLVQFTNDRDSNVSVIEWVTDAAGATAGLRYTANGRVTDFSFAQLKAGAVLESQQGINALVLKAAIDPVKGGPVTFTYVANGMTGSYESCAASISRSAAGEWMLMNSTSRGRIQTAKIVTWSMGITTLEGICAK
jgi:hypothetical protein